MMNVIALYGTFHEKYDPFRRRVLFTMAFQLSSPELVSTAELINILEDNEPQVKNFPILLNI